MRKCILLFTILMIFIASVEDLAVSAGRRIVVFPFYDDSGYRGPWELRTEVPEMLGDMLMDDYFYVVPMDSVLESMPKPPPKSLIKKFLGLFSNRKTDQRIMSDLEAISIARKLNSDYAITGILDDFKFRRQGGGDVIIGGYKSYTTNVSLSHVRVLRVSDGTPLGTMSGQADKKESGLGLELLGKPRELDIEFYSLDSLDFGSKRFLGTLMGITAVEALNKVHTEIRAVLTLPDTSFYAEKKFKIISANSGIVSIDAGSLDGVKPGDRFRVFASESGILVGKINITEVWTDHMSKGDIIEGRDAVRTGDMIMPE
ncbi:hypothetical protein ACFL6H_09915 [Candidatus Latescibacterota bacterium]